jgi:hypothetical protein
MSDGQWNQKNKNNRTKTHILEPAPAVKLLVDKLNLPRSENIRVSATRPVEHFSSKKETLRQKFLSENRRGIPIPFSIEK